MQASLSTRQSDGDAPNGDQAQHTLPVPLSAMKAFHRTAFPAAFSLSAEVTCWPGELAVPDVVRTALPGEHRRRSPRHGGSPSVAMCSWPYDTEGVHW